MTKAKQANRTAGKALARILDESPGPQTTALLIARAAAALRENLDALGELEEIAEKMKTG